MKFADLMTTGVALTCLLTLGIAAASAAVDDPQTGETGAGHRVDVHECLTRSRSMTQEAVYEVRRRSHSPYILAIEAHTRRTGDVPTEVRCRHTGSHGGNDSHGGPTRPDSIPAFPWPGKP